VGERWVRTSVTWGTCTRLAGRKPRRADRDAISTASFAPGLSHVWIDSRCSFGQGVEIVQKSTLLAIARSPGRFRWLPL
jgi:hypothetical protein